MKFKNITSTIIMVVSFFLYFSPMAKADKLCVEGKIKHLQHDRNGNISIDIGSMILYTDRPILKPLLFSAYLLDMGVQIKTKSQYCYNGGYFEEVAFMKN